MKWHLKVPQILHLYWNMEKLSYLQYLTVRTFMEINPDWEIILWYPKYPSKVVTWKTKEQEYELKFVDDYLPQLKDLSIASCFVNFPGPLNPSIHLINTA